MDRDWNPLTSALAAVLGWAGHSVFGGTDRPTCTVPAAGTHSAWEEPDADACPACPACTCDEELRQLLTQQLALEWWRLLAAVLGVIAGVAVLLLALIGLCWAGACGGCCRRRPADPGHPAAAAAALGAGRSAPGSPVGARPTPELLALLAAREVRR